MIIDSKKYNGACDCGKTHAMTTDLCVIEPRCLKNAISLCGLSGRSVAVYDTNTYAATEGSRPQVDFEIVLDADGLHADDHGTELLFASLPSQFDFILAIGAGTIHDLCRYCGYKLNKPFVSCPTAASVDGFCSSVAVMTWHGYKNTMTAAAPVAVIADTDIIAKAPLYLSLSGVGDMLGKFISLAEWKMATLLTGEYFCKKIYDITLDATNAVLESADRLESGDTDAYEKLIYGLLMSGLAMQLLGSSRCASGAEHHISHMIEMSPPRLECDSHALHGQKVGVATLLVAREYHRIKNVRPRFGDYKKATDEYIKEIFGDKLCDSIIKENTNDAADGITAKLIEENFDEICKIIDEIPSFDELVRLYKKLGVKSTLSDIGVGEDKLEFLLDNSPIVRNRLTLMRLRRAI